MDSYFALKNTEQLSPICYNFLIESDNKTRPLIFFKSQKISKRWKFEEQAHVMTKHNSPKRGQCFKSGKITAEPSKAESNTNRAHNVYTLGLWQLPNPIH